LDEQDKEPKPMVQEVSSSEPVIEGVSPSSKKPAAAKKETAKGGFNTSDSAPMPSKPAKTKTLDKEIVDKAASMASDQATENSLKNIPKSAASLEKDFNQLKRDSGLVYQYIKQIPLKNILSIYKKTEVSTEVVSGLLNTLSVYGAADVDSCKHTCQFLTNLSKADNFEMTLMFMEDREQKMIVKIKDESSKKLKGDDSKFTKAFQTGFNI